MGLAAFAEPDRVQSTAVHLAMAALSPPERESDHAPYALSSPGGLETALTAAGLQVAAQGEVECVWRYETAADAVRALIGSAGGTRAVQDAGQPAVRAAIETALRCGTGCRRSTSSRRCGWPRPSSPAWPSAASGGSCSSSRTRCGPRRP